MKGAPRNASPDEKTRAFVERARAIHGEEYDYSRVRYKTSDDPVEVMCSKHGPFYPIPYNHLGRRKTGCDSCGAERRTLMMRQRHKKTFLTKAEKKHGDKYDYSRADYQGNETPVVIICSVEGHGPFRQSPHEHLGGSGCQKCGNANKNRARSEKASATFVPRARKKHGRKFDYSRVKYQGADKHVLVGCRKEGHGFFPITPNNHLNGWGCPECKKDKLRALKTYTKKEFVALAREVHGDKYRYSGKYLNGRTQMEMECPIHGPFKQPPHSHLQGRGCRTCGDGRTRQAGCYTHEEFVAKARAAHGDKYSYPEQYQRSDCHIKIICPKHGPFPQLPSDHVQGHGCDKCRTDLAAERYRKDHETFLREARAIHGERYAYLGVYTSNRKPITIICPDHGPFTQKPVSHINRKAGCPACSQSKGERAVALVLESLKIVYVREMKFDECRSKSPLPFDFWLPDHNTLIEYDGEQHFVSNLFFGGDEGLKDLQRRDGIKTRYARMSGKRLIRVKFSVEDIESHILDALGMKTTGQSLRAVK